MLGSYLCNITPNKSNKTRALLREIDRLDLSTGEYTPLCYVPGHCFNGCGISPDNEIFCREKWLSAVFDRKGGMKSVGPQDLQNFLMERTIWPFSFGDFSLLQWEVFSKVGVWFGFSHSSPETYEW